MQFCRRASDLEWSDRVSPDVAHVGGVPIEAFDFGHPMLSIYDRRIYVKRTPFTPSSLPHRAAAALRAIFLSVVQVLLTVLHMQGYV